MSDDQRGDQMKPRFVSYRMVRIAVGAIAILAIALLLPDEALARAGGGGGYGGGGGGGFGGGGGGFGGGGFGGGGSGGSEGDLVFSVVVGIGLWLVFEAVKWGQQQQITRTIRQGHARQAEALLNQTLAQIQKSDEGFDQASFLERISTAFVQIQRDWSQQDMRPSRAFISDGVFERFSLQLDMQEAEGKRNVMQDVVVRDAAIVAATSTDQFDTLHVKFFASATDYQVFVESGREVSGTRRSESFVEFWSFHRRHGAKTRPGSGSIEGCCPSCAAPLEIVDKAQCESCGAWVNSAEHDWILAEITQQEEWNLPGDDESTPGLAALRERDTYFSVQHVEDRVSVMFWRMRAAEFYRRPAVAMPVLANGAPELLASLSADVERERFVDQPAVGIVDLIDLTSRGECDVARVKVRWSGTKCAGDPTSSKRVLHRQAIYTEVFVLERNSSVQSDPRETFASASCSSCGAPLAVNRVGACTYCDASLTDGSHDWVLVDIRPFVAEINRYSEQLQQKFEASNRRKALGAISHTPHADRGLDLAMIARVLKTDGDLNDKEVKAFRKMAEREGIAESQANLMLQNADYLDVDLPLPESGEDALRQMRQVAYATLVDGHLSRGEKKLLARYGKHFELSAADIKLVLRQTRGQLYREAKAS